MAGSTATKVTKKEPAGPHLAAAAPYGQNLRHQPIAINVAAACAWRQEGEEAAPKKICSRGYLLMRKWPHAARPPWPTPVAIFFPPTRRLARCREREGLHGSVQHVLKTTAPSASGAAPPPPTQHPRVPTYACTLRADERELRSTQGPASWVQRSVPCTHSCACSSGTAVLTRAQPHPRIHSQILFTPWALDFCDVM